MDTHCVLQSFAHVTPISYSATHIVHILMWQHSRIDS